MGLALPEVREKGWQALVSALGYAGATKFILLSEKGRGDYTKEREVIFRGATIESILQEIKGEDKK
ncbi:MAG: hypothetical protein JRF40_14625 [Deltaproteobacteria bacterium]|jgi:hypothetical protein|nr:hypothetical protein [Deltaproteobacteria bacterium]MBW2220701.1 hypothetical protein [Deltaproteobacteria bacterium]